MHCSTLNRTDLAPGHVPRVMHFPAERKPHLQPAAGHPVEPVHGEGPAAGGVPGHHALAAGVH